MAIIKVLIDTNAYIEFKRGNQQTLEILQHAQMIGINNIVLGELLAGFSVGTREAENQQELYQFLEIPRVKLFSLEEATARYYAIVYKQLRNKGKPIPTNDMWIAATALQHQFALLSYDKHFSNIDGLLQGQQLSDFLLSTHLIR